MDEGADGPRGWRDGSFARYWSGHALSAFGDQISALALPLIAVRVLDASAGQVGLLTAAVWAPSVLSMFVGAWVDQHGHQQRLLMVSDIARCLTIAVVPALYGAGQLTMTSLVIVALALGGGGVLYLTSYPAFFVRLVPERQYLAANSLLSTTLSLAGLAGPVAAGVLVEALSAPDALLVDAATFLCSAAAISTVRLRGPRAAGTAPVEPEPYLRRLRSGAGHLRRSPYLRASLLASTTMNLAGFAVQAVIVVCATRHLHLSAGQIGVALSLGATGGLLGAITAAPVAIRIGVGRAIALGAGLNVLPFAAVALAAARPSTGVLALTAAEFVSAWAVMLFDVNNNSLRAVVTADGMRGRVAGAYSTVNYGSRPVGALLGGALATVVGVPGTLLVAALAGTLAAGWIIRSPVFGMHLTR